MIAPLVKTKRLTNIHGSRVHIKLLGPHLQSLTNLRYRSQSVAQFSVHPLFQFLNII